MIEASMQGMLDVTMKDILASECWRLQEGLQLARVSSSNA